MIPWERDQEVDLQCPKIQQLIFSVIAVAWHATLPVRFLSGTNLLLQLKQFPKNQMD